MAWFKWRSNQVLEPHKLPGNVGSVSIPKGYVVEYENDDTLLAYPKGTSDIGFRFSSISFVARDGGLDRAADHLEKQARCNGDAFERSPDKGVASYEQESVEDGIPLLIKYWKIGQKNTVVIMSATIVADSIDQKHVVRALDLVNDIIASVSVRKHHRIIQKDDGTKIETSVETVDPEPQTFREFGANDQNWLARGLQQARRLSFRFGTGSDLDPAELDIIFSAWLSDQEDQYPGELVADALGAAFGEYLVSNNGFRWGIITDRFGDEFAVQDSASETFAYPRASVEKRIATRQADFFQNVYAAVLDQVRRAPDAN